MRVAAATIAAFLALAALPAAAQDTDVGGTVESELRLSLGEVDGFATFPAGPGEHELAVRARITSTVGRALLSVADGDVASGARLGRMASATSVLDQPLEARARSEAFQPLDAAIDPLLADFGRPLANESVTVRLRQRIDAGERPRGIYSKTVLITLSSNAP